MGFLLVVVLLELDGLEVSLDVLAVGLSVEVGFSLVLVVGLSSSIAYSTLRLNVAVS